MYISDPLSMCITTGQGRHLSREHLQRKRAASPAGSGGAGLVAANDATLHQAVLATGLVRSIRKVYILRATGNTSADRLRSVVLDLLKVRRPLCPSQVFGSAYIYYPTFCA